MVIGPPLRLGTRLQVTGTEHVPATGPVIIASNHVSFCDSLFIPLAAGRPVNFLGKQEYFTGRGVTGRFVASFMRAIGTIPVERGSGRAAAESLDIAEEVLRGGGAFGIYPEGTRSPDGRLYKGRTGVARLVVRTGAPVIPCALIGTDKVQPVDARVLRPAKVRARLGPALDFSEHLATLHKSPLLRAITDDVMDAIAAMSGQQRSAVYASTAKAEMRKVAAAEKRV